MGGSRGTECAWMVLHACVRVCEQKYESVGVRTRADMCANIDRGAHTRMDELGIKRVEEMHQGTSYLGGETERFMRCAFHNNIFRLCCQRLEMGDTKLLYRTFHRMTEKLVRVRSSRRIQFGTCQVHVLVHKCMYLCTSASLCKGAFMSDMWGCLYVGKIDWYNARVHVCECG